MRDWASDTEGSAGMAPFFVVHIAPQAFENASACFSFASSYIYDLFKKIKQPVFGIYILGYYVFPLQNIFGKRKTDII